jgi:hypothetical protein
MKGGSGPKAAPQTTATVIKTNRSPRWAIFRYPKALWPRWYVDPRDRTCPCGCGRRAA